ncbi:hypothetical protein Q1J45_25925 [Pseudomonas rhodesiae]|uniref:hypothetical protein n=1 Tax=Bacillus cereus group TaxID=86661 RepID=UPI0018CF1F08|nr:hypothetical protein [Bacillus thuringiensis]
MADIKDPNYVVQQITEEFNLQDGQSLDGEILAKMIARSQELFKEKSDHDAK